MIRVGGEIDALCVRCGLVLAHTVHALVAGRPVRVECNTCHAVHAARASGGAGPRPRPRPAGERRTAAPPAGFDALLASKSGPARPYSPREVYAAGDLLEHPVFGRGVVSGLRDGGKIEVVFRSATRILVHGRA
ncbi:MAG TPA: hypothetical protein VLS93_06120 [Anaeromyxobacteraceae bacterium]|nr:hypothetical protein [Anaeromyxobacteraceae bacterium]